MAEESFFYSLHSAVSTQQEREREEREWLERRREERTDLRETLMQADHDAVSHLQQLPPGKGSKSSTTLGNKKQQIHSNYDYKNNKQTLWTVCVSELYRPSDHSL
jgi:hypothetical protein